MKFISQNTISQYFPLVVLIIGITIGCFSGRFYGQVEVFRQILNDKIECSLTVNPITAEMMDTK